MTLCPPDRPPSAPFSLFLLRNKLKPLLSLSYIRFLTARALHRPDPTIVFRRRPTGKLPPTRFSWHDFVANDLDNMQGIHYKNVCARQEEVC